LRCFKQFAVLHARSHRFLHASICKAAVRRTFTDFNLLLHTLHFIPFHFASFNFPICYLMNLINFINLQLVLDPQRYNNRNAKPRALKNILLKISNIKTAYFKNKITLFNRKAANRLKCVIFISAKF